MLKLKVIIYYAKLYLHSLNLLLNKKRLLFELSSLKKHPPTIIIGSYFSKVGGVSHHIANIKKYSKEAIDTLPNTKSLALIETNNLREYYNAKIEGQNLAFKIVHSHVDPWFINLCLKAQSNGAKWVHTYHTIYFEKDWINGLALWQEQTNEALIHIAKDADYKISISKWLKRHLKEQYQIDTVYIPNGVDVSKCDLAEASRFKNKYKLQNDFILFAGGIADIKNSLDFIKLAEALPDKQFIMVGNDATLDGVKNKYQLNLPKNLSALGPLSHEDLLDAIAACRVFVVTSRSEGLPTVLMEAMALKCSVVGCNTYGTKEVIHSEEYGYLYKYDSVEDLVAQTRLAYEVSKGEKARQRILENYDWRIVIPQLDAVYNNIL